MKSRGNTPLAAIILAAGQGTRMKSEKAKVLHALGGEPLVSYPIGLALSLKADPVALVVGHQAATVEEIVSARFGDRVRFQLQKKQLGTGHAVIQGMKSLDGFSGSVVILSGDVPFLTKDTLRRAMRQQQKHGHAVVVVTMEPKDPTGYGRMVKDERGSVVRIVEHKDASASELEIGEVNAGIYVCDASFLRKALKKLKNDNAQKEYYLTDIIQVAEKKGETVGTIVVSDPMEVEGVNHRGQLAQLEARLRRTINLEHMVAGVSIVDPDSTYISRQARIGRDTVIQPGVHIRGASKIGSGCMIDTGCIISSSVIHDDVSVHPYSILEDAEVYNEANIGPFARLRPAAKIKQRARVGNFVEVKKSTLGEGAKANHLAYIGDAEIGPGSNIGAGTITCNYDGHGKYKTDIGAGVFVGSNSTLVAPVRLGAGVYVAAGSTITESAPKDSLVLGRARQIEKPGRGKQIRITAEKRAAKEKAKKNGHAEGKAARARKRSAKRA